MFSCQVLGAVMFSCGGRGPQEGFFPRRSYDVSEYIRVFGSAIGTTPPPLLGLYAGGEIGPLALAGVSETNELCRTQKGRAKLQVTKM